MTWLIEKSIAPLVEIDGLAGRTMKVLRNCGMVAISAWVIGTCPITYAAEEHDGELISETVITDIQGDWEGSITNGGPQGFPVVWRFELDDSDALIGFMGPREIGAYIPMSEIVVTESALSFTVENADGQGGKGQYSGHFSAGRIDGKWVQGGQELVLNMSRKAP